MPRCLLSLTALLLSSIVYSQQPAPLILTSVSPLFHITQTLTEGTGIEVRNLPDPPRPLSALGDYYQRQVMNQSALLQRADAVVSLASFWDGDLLYAAGRDVNIRLVHIDATRTQSLATGSLALVTSTVTGNRLPHFWLSPSSLLASIDIIARDLQRLYPAHANQIANNLAQQRRYLNELRSSTERALLTVETPVIFALADEFTYLSNDLGIEVEGYFIKQDINWTQDDLETLRRTLQESGVEVVVHKWQPAPSIVQAIQAAGARLLVLNPLEVIDGDWKLALEHNLELLIDSLQQP
jgi:ABC-type Zn uptake system ZnuABC Zn-binding protein ZnuA